MPAALMALLLAAADAPPAAPKEVSPLTVTGQAKEAPPADVTITIGADQDTLAHQVSIWPSRALAARVGGRVTLACRVDIHGLAERCEVIHEEPIGKGFGAAALALRPTLKLTPRQGPEGPVPSLRNVAINFKAPATQSNIADVMAQGRTIAPEGGDNGGNDGGHELNARNLLIYNNPVRMRRITMMTSPAWAAAPDFDRFAAAYPAEGGGVDGYAVAHCRVEATGVLTRCKVAKETPQGRGFGKAAVALAPQFRLPPEAMAQAPPGAPDEG
jgi:hypothetical protein